MTYRSDGYKSGFASLIGRPNVGKSTLLNAILAQKVAIVSPKPQTTRTLIRGVYTSERGQIIFVDTPGIHEPRHTLGKHMVSRARRAMGDADVVVLVYDALVGWHDQEQELLELLRKSNRDYVVVANKVDAAVSEITLPTGVDPSNWLAVSAITGQGVDRLIDLVMDRLPEGPQYFPPEMVTDQPEQVLAAEFIREAVLHLTRDEVPHSVAVQVDEFRYNERKDLTTIRATIYVERDSQKKIIIGRNGAMIREIGQVSRVEIEKILGTRVFLDLWVKVKPKWRDTEGTLQNLGLGEGQ